MKSVFLVQHLHGLSQEEEEHKIIGVYSSYEAAQAAVKRLGAVPGFRDFPRLVNPLIDDNANGFYIDEYSLDSDHWSEGFVTIHHG